MIIKEIVVVEGRDDTAAVRRAAEADTIETHGYGISRQTWELLEKACEERGLIIFTDPDFTGNEIRRRLKERFPDAKEAFLARDEATSAGDVGIENGTPEAIREALSKVCVTLSEKRDEFTADDLFAYGLTGGAGSAERRALAGKKLGIGAGNGSAFLKKLNAYGVTREKLESVLAEIEKDVK